MKTFKKLNVYNLSQKWTIDAPRQIWGKRPKMKDSLYAQNLENIFMNID